MNLRERLDCRGKVGTRAPNPYTDDAGCERIGNGFELPQLRIREIGASVRKAFPFARHLNHSDHLGPRMIGERMIFWMGSLRMSSAMGTASNTEARGTTVKLLNSSGRFSRALRAASEFALESGMWPTPRRLSGPKKRSERSSAVSQTMATSWERTWKSLLISSTARLRRTASPSFLRRASSVTHFLNRLCVRWAFVLRANGR